MHAIFGAFATLVSRADDPDVFEDPSHHDEILAALRAMDAHLKTLEGGGGPLTAAHLSARRSLSQDVAASIDAFVTGRYEGARFVVGQMTESCFACHTKLPSDHAFDLGARLLESEPVAGMTLGQRAMIAVAARQFDAALELHEQLLVDPHYPPVEIALSGALESYLKLALRVADEPERARQNLGAFRKRPDVPRYLASEIDAWVAALGQSEPEGPTAVARAREWIRRGLGLTVYPGDRRGLVPFVMASRELHRGLREPPEDPSARAEIFYWLGICEIHITPSLWLSEAEDFLEESIRTAPQSEHADRAYETLEAVWIEGFTGSGGTHLPVEVERRLGALRELVDATEAEPKEKEGGRE
jgi:hypothetical protein